MTAKPAPAAPIASQPAQPAAKPAPAPVAVEPERTVATAPTGPVPSAAQSASEAPPPVPQSAPVPTAEPEKVASPASPPASPRRSVGAVLPGPADRIHEGLNWEFCGPRPADMGPVDLPPAPSEETALYLDADAAEYDQTLEQVTLRGRIEAERGAQRVEADELVYDRRTGEMRVTGQAFFEHPGVRIAGERADLNIEKEQGTLWDVRYRLMGRINALGTAEEAEVVSSDLTHYRSITYSTCPPGRGDWSLYAEELEIDQESGRGTARHAQLRAGSLPVLYTPYLRFPIDSRRQSGFLVPTIGSSSETGLDITTPYYFNIAPALDATLAPRYMSKHGLLMGGELRYLTSNQSGEISGEILPQDKARDDRATRGILRVRQSGLFGGRWQTAVNFNQVSDNQYFEDFGSRLEVTSIRNIERRGDLTYLGDGWSVLTRLQSFQTVDESVVAEDRPYDRLPQVLFQIDPLRYASGLEFGGDAEYVYFDHSTNVRGQRVAVAPYVRWPLRRSFGHLIPKARFYGASYSLSDEEPGASESPSYSIPSFSVDGQLVFERTVDWFGAPAMQTIEPRLFYLFTPYEDQSENPVFDTTELDFSYSSLFRENRFTGRDRIGDANQLTIGFTTRTIAEQTGDELLRVSLGQILYFDNPRVQISDQVDDDRNSAIAGELAAKLAQHLSARASFQWDPDPGEEDARWERRALQFRYQADDARLINAGYLYNVGTSDDTRYEDTDLSFRWPLGTRVDMVGRWLYSLLYDETMESIAGIEYGRCCWRLRLIGRHYKNSPESDGNTSVMVQLELAGLGSFGNTIDALLERSIYGYESN
ncbi:organic solvent tolerance protein OstA [Thioflavicoccus mobilis 8321]|uniref:LPS-assembly protein LptD n=1 Tax=Thioflavicoccus mobilis 8321 TaxID=765912 RepID=L0H2R3_9GAMM|nr:LPS-assembly protein LptD [Thioflavicoccus mobilis]AGA91945.1 organic solvent tolerance protein OstA [Thioflavicoccus mobilis 8321]